jgi:hypothetical protein
VRDADEVINRRTTCTGERIARARLAMATRRLTRLRADAPVGCLLARRGRFDYLLEVETETQPASSRFLADRRDRTRSLGPACGGGRSRKTHDRCAFGEVTAQPDESLGQSTPGAFTPGRPSRSSSWRARSSCTGTAESVRSAPPTSSVALHGTSSLAGHHTPPKNLSMHALWQYRTRPLIVFEAGARHRLDIDGPAILLRRYTRAVHDGSAWRTANGSTSG